MKRALVFAASLAAMLIASSPARAWDPDQEDDWTAPEPAPAWADPTGWSDPPPGMYLVTETYVEDVVTRSGPVTTYTTETVHEITGSYARVLETVGTGTRSDFDGAAFNGRAGLADGRSVAGTYYENFIRTDGGYVPVSIVFFQDDLEIARATRPTEWVASPVDVPADRSDPAAVAPAPGTGDVTPLVDSAMDRRRSLEEREAAVAIVVPGGPVRGPLADRAIEVLRARRISVVFSDPGVVRWRFASGEVVVLGPTSGAAPQPFVARWDLVPPAGGVWVTRFAVDLSDGTTRDLALRVTVRAPGLVE